MHSLGAKILNLNSYAPSTPMLYYRVRVSKGPFLEVSTLSSVGKVGDTEIGKTLI